MENNVKLTQSHLRQALSSKGALSTAQFKALGYKSPFKGWKRLLVGRMFTEIQIKQFISLQDAHRIKRGQKVRKKKGPQKEIVIHGKYDHPEWIVKRDAILDRDKRTCVRCGKHKYDGVLLNVHHLLYINGNDLWDVPDYYLVTLCQDCHKYEHSIAYTPPPKIFDKHGNRIKK